MNCADFENLLTGYAEGALDPVVAAEMEQHRSNCASCHLLLQEVARLVEALHCLPELEPPEGLVDSILRNTPGIHRRRSFWGGIVVPTFQPFLTQRFAAATAILCVFISMTVSLLEPGFPGFSASDFSPGGVVRRVDTLSHRAYRRVLQIDQWTIDRRADLDMWVADWSSRVDGQIIAALFRGYDEAVQDQQQKEKGK